MTLATLCLMTGLQARPAPPSHLAPETFEAVRRYVALTPEETLYTSITWHPRVHRGLTAAAEQDRPVVMWMYFGDPQGQC